jgi:hypothetical protein
MGLFDYYDEYLDDESVVDWSCNRPLVLCSDGALARRLHASGLLSTHWQK